MKPAFAAGAALTLVMLPGCHRPPARGLAADSLTPVPAARYIVAAFVRYPLVAFSEPRHGAGGTKQFFAALLREPGFAGTIQDLVIECGNACYQDVVDRYIAVPVASDAPRTARDGSRRGESRVERREHRQVTAVWHARSNLGLYNLMRTTQCPVYVEAPSAQACGC